MVHTIYLSGYSASYQSPYGSDILMLGTKESHGIEELELVANSDWNSLAIYAVFENPSGEKTRMLADDSFKVQVPPEATKEAGIGNIVIVGQGTDSRRITVNVPYRVMDHSGIDGEDSDPTPDIFQQIIKTFPPGGKAGQVLAKRTDADRDVEWRDILGSGDFSYGVGHGLKINYDTMELEVDSVNEAAEDNTLPITSGAVYKEIGNIEVLLASL